MDVVIVGSGPASAAAALALSPHDDVAITILDVGATLEADRESARARMSHLQPTEWSSSDRELIAALPARERLGAVPKKQIYGSDFPFTNVGQLASLSSRSPANQQLTSGAYGGFSNTWGAQTMAYSEGTFETWPFTRSALEPHYRAILDHVPFAGTTDDLADLFPLLGSPVPLPPDAPTTEHALAHYERHRTPLRHLGVVVGRARLALDANRCVRCGLCMTGCPYGLIYSASQTFDALRQSGRVRYVSGVTVYRVSEGPDGRVTVSATSGRETLSFTADRVLLGAGAVGTTRIVAGSLDLRTTFEMEESAQFLAPFLSRQPANALTQEGEYTLNQFNVLVTLDDRARDAALIHCYPYNDIMAAALPEVPLPLVGVSLRRTALRHLTVGLGYLPSWESPKLLLSVGDRPSPIALPETRLDWRPRPNGDRFFRRVKRRLRRAGPFLDLHFVPFGVRRTAPGKSYHFGGSFPHDPTGARPHRSDLLGRVGPWRNVHLIDASVFPTVPATTITLSIMANAHRIATGVVEGRS